MWYCDLTLIVTVPPLPLGSADTPLTAPTSTPSTRTGSLVTMSSTLANLAFTVVVDAANSPAKSTREREHPDQRPEHDDDKTRQLLAAQAETTAHSTLPKSPEVIAKKVEESIVAPGAKSQGG